MTADFRPVEPLGDHHVIDRFDSGADDLDRWLRRTARTAALVGTAATYVLASCEPDPPEPDIEPGADAPALFEVIGYYALAVRSIEQDLGPRLLGRGIPDSVPVVQIPRLALHRDAQGVGLGAELLIHALRRSLAIAPNVGARAVVVDAVDESAYGYYEHLGFEPLEAMRLFKSLPDLEQALAG